MTKKKPSAKQLAARAKFVKMVRAKAAKRKAAKNKTVGKIVKKKTVKKAAKKKTIKQTGTSNKTYDKRFSAKKPGKRISKKGNKYTENRENRSDKGRLLGVMTVNNNLIEKYKQLNTEITKYNKIYDDYVKAKKLMSTLKNKAAVIQYNIDIKRISNYLKEIKTHAKELKKLI